MQNHTTIIPAPLVENKKNNKALALYLPSVQNGEKIPEILSDDDFHQKATEIIERDYFVQLPKLRLLKAIDAAQNANNQPDVKILKEALKECEQTNYNPQNNDSLNKFLNKFKPLEVCNVHRIFHSNKKTQKCLMKDKMLFQIEAANKFHFKQFQNVIPHNSQFSEKDLEEHERLTLLAKAKNDHLKIAHEQEQILHQKVTAGNFENDAHLTFTQNPLSIEDIKPHLVTWGKVLKNFKPKKSNVKSIVAKSKFAKKLVAERLKHDDSAGWGLKKKKRH